MADIECFLVKLVNERQEEPRNGKEYPGHTTYDVARSDNGEVLRRNVGWFYEAGQLAVPAGAMWWRDIATLPDPPELGARQFFAGEHLVVMTPGGTWNIDSRASNCARPDDRVHRCWPRRGRPPKVTVDKAFGETCDAGAGSIQVGAYHGFLVSGVLRES